MWVKHGMKQNKLIIGLTGGSGCGKSIVAKAAEDLGFVHIDTDKIGHEIILKPNKAYFQLISEFGTEILAENDEINRKKLGEIVFSNPEKLKKLSEITHPAIIEKTKELIDEYTVIDGAVIHQTPEIMKMCHKIIAVTNSDDRRIKFICSRDNISIHKAKDRVKSQPDNEFYSNIADIVIHSDCDIDQLYNKSYDIFKRCISEKNN